MDAFNSIIIENEIITLTLGRLLLAVLSILVVLVLLLITRKVMKRENITTSLGESNAVMIKNFLFTVFIFLGIYVSLELIGIKVGKYLNFAVLKTDNVKIYVYHFIIFYLIIVGTKVLLSILETIISTKEQASQIERGKTKNIYQIIRYFIYLIAVGVFVQSLGINITILIASLSALLLGLGLGLQHLFNDMVSGLILLFDRSIKIGDVIEIKNELIGKVISINLRTSVLVSRDEIEVIVPNSKFTSDNIINWTHNSVQTRFFVKVGVAYGSDVRLVEKILIDAAKNNRDVLKVPEPQVQFIDFGDSSLDFKLIFFSERTFRIERIKSELRFEIDRLFRENKVTIPFPQRDVHFYNHSK